MTSNTSFSATLQFYEPNRKCIGLRWETRTQRRPVLSNKPVFSKIFSFHSPSLRPFLDSFIFFLYSQQQEIISNNMAVMTLSPLNQPYASSVLWKAIYATENIYIYVFGNFIPQFCIFLVFWVMSMQVQSYLNMFTTCKKKMKWNNKNNQIALFKVPIL